MLYNLATVTILKPGTKQKNQKSTKPLTRKIEHRYVTQMSGSSPPKLDGDVVPSLFVMWLLQPPQGFTRNNKRKSIKLFTREITRRHVTKISDAPT